MRYNALFADAEVGEDVFEDVGGGDFAGDGAEVVEHLADILAQKVGRQAVVEGIECRLQ